MDNKRDVFSIWEMADLYKKRQDRFTELAKEKTAKMTIKIYTTGDNCVACQ